MLRIDGVSYRYPGAPQPALSEVSLAIPSGGVFGLLGPNGAGKTTLISLLAGLSTAAAGTISLDGQPLASARAANPRAIALVPQDYAFYPMLTVAENLAFFGGALDLDRRQQKQRAEAAISFARLEQVVDQRAEQLSGGLRRRLNLAIGLLGQPRLLLLDEPTVGVDPQSRHFLLESIAGLAASGTTVIYTSHYMEEVEMISQHLAILDHGQVLAAGTLDELLATAGNAAELELDRPLPPELSERCSAEALGSHKYRLNLASTAAAGRLLDDLANAGCIVRQLQIGRQNLEQLFMRLTKRSLRD